LSLARRYPPAQWRSISTWGIHLGLCTAIGLIYSAWRALLEVLLNPWANPSGPGTFSHIWKSQFYNGLLADLIIYGTILLVSSMLVALFFFHRS
jgi:hypothetical protein